MMANALYLLQCYQCHSAVNSSLNGTQVVRQCIYKYIIINTITLCLSIYGEIIYFLCKIVVVTRIIIILLCIYARTHT
jgi:hypothetical protein